MKKVPFLLAVILYISMSYNSYSNYINIQNIESIYIHNERNIDKNMLKEGVENKSIKYQEIGKEKNINTEEKKLKDKKENYLRTLAESIWGIFIFSSIMVPLFIGGLNIVILVLEKKIKEILKKELDINLKIDCAFKKNGIVTPLLLFLFNIIVGSFFLKNGIIPLNFPLTFLYYLNKLLKYIFTLKNKEVFKFSGIFTFFLFFISLDIVEIFTVPIGESFIDYLVKIFFNL